MILQVEPSWSVADNLTLILVITTIIGIYIQHRAFKVAKRDLEIKVRDVESLVKEISDERLTRTQQIEERKAEDIRLLEHSNEMNKLSSQISGSTRTIYRTHFESINESLVMISTILKKLLMELNDLFSSVSKSLGGPESKNTSVELTVDLLDKITNKNLVSFESHELQSKFSEELETALKAFEANMKENLEFVSEKTDAFHIEYGKAQKQLEIDIALVHANHAVRINEFKKEYDKVKSELSKTFDALVAHWKNEATSESAEKPA